MKQLLLAVDVGNTNIVLGVFEGDRLIASWRVRTERDITVDEFGVLVRNLFSSRGLELGDASAMIISCVVPPMLNTLEAFGHAYLNAEAMVVGPGIKTGVPILLDNPKEVGADRIVNVVAAFKRYRRAMIVVDFGTATTFDYVSPRGEYMGGAIAPGLVISSEALYQKASKLQRIEIFSLPRRAVAKDTVSAMNVGLVFGYVGLVDGLVKRIKDEVETDPIVLATGGLASLIAGESETIDEVLPDLTLEGLKILYERNKPTP